MVPLIAPNGVQVMASDADAERMLRNGYRRVEEPRPAPRKRTTRKKQEQ